MSRINMAMLKNSVCKGILSISQAAYLSNMHHTTLRRLCNAGEIDSFNLPVMMRSKSPKMTSGARVNAYSLYVYCVIHRMPVHRMLFDAAKAYKTRYLFRQSDVSKSLQVNKETGEVDITLAESLMIDPSEIEQDDNQDQVPDYASSPNPLDHPEVPESTQGVGIDPYTGKVNELHESRIRVARQLAEAMLDSQRVVELADAGYDPEMTRGKDDAFRSIIEGDDDGDDDNNNKKHTINSGETESSLTMDDVLSRLNIQERNLPSTVTMSLRDVFNKASPARAETESPFHFTDEELNPQASQPSHPSQLLEQQDPFAGLEDPGKIEIKILPKPNKSSCNSSSNPSSSPLPQGISREKGRSIPVPINKPLTEDDIVNFELTPDVFDEFDRPAGRRNIRNSRR